MLSANLHVRGSCFINISLLLSFSQHLYFTEILDESVPLLEERINERLPLFELKNKWKSK